MKQTLAYSLKVWLTSAIVTPLFLTLWNTSTIPGHPALVDVLESTLFIMVYGLVLSMPCLILLWVCTTQLTKRRISELVTKLILSIIGIPVIFGLIRIVAPYSMLLLPTIYLTCVVACLWLYKLKPVTTEPTNISL